MADADYQAYIDKQKEKTTDPVRRQKWLNEEWDQKLTGFRQLFMPYLHLFKPCQNALCLGARTGQEVAAFRGLGIDAIGLDLVACPPLVLEGDIHNLNYEDESFDIIYTNVYDHALYPDKFCSEMIRVLRPGGFILINLQVQVQADKYGVTDVDDVGKEVLPLFPGCDVRVNMSIAQNVHAMNWELLVQKAKKPS